MKSPLAFALALVCAVGCSPKSNAPTDVDSAFCSWMQRCEPVIYNGWFTSNSDCIAYFTANLGPELSLPGITQSETNLMLNALNSGNCNINNIYPTGTLANGAGCSQGLQCTSGRCTSGGNGCGTCASAAAGDTCTSDNDCEQPNTCQSSVCTAPLPTGSVCTESTACQSGYCGPSITDALPTGDYFCQSQPTGAAEGETCGNIPCAVGLICTNSCTGTNCVTPSVCAKPTYVAIGQPCTDTTTCEGGRCMGTPSVCTAYLAPGTACTSDSPCRSECVITSDGGTTGVCDVHTYTTCN